MTNFMTQDWTHWKHAQGYWTINTPDQLIARTFAPHNFPEVHMTQEQTALEEAENEHIAELIAAIPEMVNLLKRTSTTINNCDCSYDDEFDYILYDIQKLFHRINVEG